MSNLQIFKNDDFGEIRVLEINGEPWLIGRDVAIALLYDEDEKDVVLTDTPGGSQKLQVVNE